MSVRLKLNDRQFDRVLLTATAEGIQRAGVFYHSRCQIAVNKSNPRDRHGRYKNSSKPGEPPRARTGHGRTNIVYEYSSGMGGLPIPTVRVGVRKNALYMYFWEVGWRSQWRWLHTRGFKYLMIPWRPKEGGERQPTEDEIKRIGLKKIKGAWYYFRRSVYLPARSHAPRPWLLPTFYRFKDTIARLAAVGGKGRIP